MPHLSHVFTLTMKFARQCRQLVQRCSGLTVDLDLSDPIANLQYDDAQICPIWGVPLKKQSLRSGPVYHYLQYISGIPYFGAECYEMLWMFILTHPMKPPGHHTCATLRSSESSSGKVPDAWPNHGLWGCIERPRSSRLSPEFLGKKTVFFSGFFLLMFGNIFWKMFFLLIFLGDPNSRMIWVKYHKISWGMWKNMLWTSCFRFFLLHGVVGKWGTQKNPVVCHGLSFSSMFKKVWVKTEEPFGSHQRPQRNYFIWVFASLLFDS